MKGLISILLALAAVASNTRLVWAEEPGRNEDVFLPSLCTSMVVNNLFVAFSRIEMEEQQLREIKLVNGVDAFDQWKQAAKWKDSLIGSPFFNISQKIWKFYEIVLTKYIYYGRISVELKNGVIPMEKTFI